MICDLNDLILKIQYNVVICILYYKKLKMKDSIIWYDMAYFAILWDLKKTSHANRWVPKISKNIKKPTRSSTNLQFKICSIKIIDNYYLFACSTF